MLLSVGEPTKMEKGAEVRGNKIIHRLVQLAFRGKTVYVNMCVCVYTIVSMSE